MLFQVLLEQILHAIFTKQFYEKFNLGSNINIIFNFRIIPSVDKTVLELTSTYKMHTCLDIKILEKE